MPSPPTRAMPCPVYPRPSKSRTPAWKFFLKTRRSWLDMLYQRSYEMKMGHVRLPGLEAFVVNEPEAVRRVLVDEYAQFPKHTLLHRMLQPLLGDSIFTTNGAQWQRQRQLLDPAFESARLKGLFPLMLDAVTSAVARLYTAADGAPVNVEAEMTHVTADIIFRTLLSMTLQEDEARQIYHAFSRFQATALQLSINQMFLLPSWLAQPRAAWQYRQAARDIRLLIERAVHARIEAQTTRPAGTAPRDLLDAMLDARLPETGDRYGERELVDQVCMLFLAGHETSASALSWALYLLAFSPEVQAGAREEVLTVIGDRAPMYEDLSRLERIRNVFRETLRLYPPVGFFARQAACPTTLRDKAVPEGAAVVISPWLIHRHRKLWQAADEFNPDRFGTEATRASLKQAYLPFGLGPRICIGAGFAMQEATLILAALLRHFRFELVPGREPQPVGRLTIRSENGIWLRVRRV